MIQHIYRTKSLDRQLDRLRKSGKKGVQAARQAEKIIKVLCSCGDAFQELKRKQTKHGELRLNNCRKYDLGSGYRLLTVQDEDCLILTYAGSHDECHQWLERHKDTSLKTSSFKSSDCTIVHVTVKYTLPQLVGYSPLSDSTPEPDPYEENLLSRIDEKTLHYIFRGFCRSN